MAEIILGQGDAVTAVIEWLADDAALDPLEDAIFGFELPGTEAASMPKPALVVSDAGGFANDLAEVVDRARVDIRHYGRTLDEAKAIAVLVRARMRALRRFVASNGLVLLPAVRSGGYIPLREPIGDWPLVLRSYLVLYAEEAAA